MGVKIPEYRLKSPYDLKHLRDRMTHKKRRGFMGPESLTLTSFIDILSVVILFLIQSFSANGDIFLVNPAIKIPEANFAQELSRAPIITIESSKVTIEGLKVGDNDQIGEKIEETDWDLPLLTQRLGSYKQFWESIHQGTPFPGDVIIQADKKLEFIYLKRVMFALTKMGFNGINLAVRGESKGPPPKADANDAAAPAPQEAPADSESN